MGSGKSSVGRSLADSLGWEFIDLDRYIEHKIGLKINEIFREGEEHFRAVEAEAVRDVVTLHQITGTDVVLALGGGTICTHSIRGLILEQTLCIYLKVGLDTIVDRLGTCSASRPLFRNLNQVEELFDTRTPAYESAPCHIICDGKSAHEVAEEIKAFIFK